MNTKTTSKYISILICLLFLGNFVNITLSNSNNDFQNEINNKNNYSTLSASWPTSWLQIGTDPNENGWNDDYRDVRYAYYNFDDDYLYLRLECYGIPAFLGSSEGRFKWFIDLDDDIYLSGRSIIGGEYVLFVEDFDNQTITDDNIGDVFFLEDIDYDNMFSEWEQSPDYYTQGIVNDPNIAGYRIIGYNVDLYINKDNIGNPTSSCFAWATDQENPNIEQAPTTDHDNPIKTEPLPISNTINVEKQVWNESSNQWGESIITSIGDILQFRIIISNIGDVDFYEVEVNDNLPIFLDYNGDASPVHSNNPSDQYIEWVLGSLAGGNSKTITFSTTVTDVGDGYNSASACGFYYLTQSSNTIFSNLIEFLYKIFNFFQIKNDIPQYGVLSNSNSICDSDDAYILAENIDIDLVKKVNDNGVWEDSIVEYVGETIEFKIEITNSGTTDLSNIIVTDTLPYFLIYNGVSNPSPISTSPLQWTIGTLLSGESLTITFEVYANQVNAGLDNIADVEGTYLGFYTVTDSDVAFVTIISPCQDNDNDGYNKYDQINCPTGDDCDDSDDTVFPGAPEVCDGKDNDCDGLVDEGLDIDADGDGHYLPGSCSDPDDDCDDSDDTVFPGAPEVCDGKDNDCDGLVDEGLDIDADGDGHYLPGSCSDPDDDCDDSDDTVFPGAPEVCDGKDNDCDGLVDEGLDIDADGDGHYLPGSCSDPDDDCDDSDDTVFPGAPEVCDGKDNDCDGLVDEGLDIDADGDGHYLPGSCSDPDDDCDDSDDTVFPGAPEVCDGKDNDCDGLVDEGLDIDADGDGHYLPGSCSDPDDDCDDSDDTVFPGAPEVCDGKDNDCDGLVDEGLDIDADGDGHYLPGSCSDPDDDCDDSDDTVFPGAPEVCDGKDNDCDGLVDEGLDIDADGDGHYLPGSCSDPDDDCDDSDDTVFPGAPEVCDGKDNDCDGLVDEGLDTDADGDGHYLPGSCSDPDDDCDDSDDTVFPGAPEVCDGKDNDCDGLVDEGLDTDADGDGHYLPGSCSDPDDDCDDSDDTVFPGAPEVCDGKDNDCDGLVDEGLDTDADGDGHYLPGSCSDPDDDCDDSDDTVFPGAPEVCDGKDNDCDGLVDEGLDTDADGDGHYLPGSCSDPDDDCDDSDDTVFPGAPEVCDGKDNDCDGLVDEGLDTDADGDGHYLPGSCSDPDDDCDDSDDTVFPGAPEVCDGKDNDCDGLVDEGLDTDADGDGHYLPGSCSDPDDDCDDSDDTVFPGAPEVCDGKDNDCDGLVDEGLDTDADGDGHYLPGSCSDPDDDCDDSDDTVFPGAPEVCDGKDNDCDGLVDEGLDTDADGDGHYLPGSCSDPDDDCDDSDDTVFPGAPEVCDGKDNDCDGLVDEGLDTDADGDGHYLPGSCSDPDDDCDDSDDTVFPGAPEVCDGKDNDCDGLVDEGLDTDADGDGHYLPGSCSDPDDDCDDSDDTVFPGAPEVCDGKDNDCDGLVDEGFDQDGDGWTICGGDCDDSNVSINPGMEEICDNNIDDDCDGLIDYEDSDECFLPPPTLDVEKQVWHDNKSMWVDNIRVPIETNLIFRIKITNNGDLPIHDLYVNDTLSDPQLEYRYNANLTPYFESLRLIKWYFPIIEVNETIEITYHAESVQMCYGWNEVNVTSLENFTDEDLTNVKVIAYSQPTLEITKKVWDDVGLKWVENINRNIGNDLRFKLTINCTALQRLHDIKITDYIPPNLEYRYISDPIPSVILSNKLEWNYNSIAPGEEITIIYHTRTIYYETDEDYSSEYNTAQTTCSEGHEDEDYVLILVNNIKPVAESNGPYEGFAGQSIFFNGSASGGISPYQWYWSFGDKVYSISQNPNHVYQKEGVYTICLKITDGNGNTDNDYSYIVIYPKETIIANAGGPYYGKINQSISIFGDSIGGVEPLSYYWDFNNNGKFEDAKGEIVSESWESIGSFIITLKVIDNIGTIDTDTAQVIISSNAPYTPIKPIGDIDGKTGEEYTFTTSTIDPDDDQIFYKWDWGDEISDWDGPYKSGDESNKTHIWGEKGEYEIRVKAKDQYGEESEWSEPLGVSMPYSINPIQLFLKRLINRFPILEPILSKYL